MANKTLLDTVNALFKRAKIIAGDASALTTLTDSARQADIDVAVQVVNESIDELYSSIEKSRPNQMGESFITLATGDKDYALATDLVRLHWPFVDRVNTQYLDEAAEGYEGLLLQDPMQDWTGIPYCAAIRPTDGQLFLDKTPTATENGRIYHYQYDKDTVLTAASDQMPFGDAVWRAVVPASYQLWRRERREEFDAQLFKVHLGRAARLMGKSLPMTSYNPRR